MWSFLWSLTESTKWWLNQEISEVSEQSSGKNIMTKIVTFQLTDLNQVKDKYGLFKVPEPQICTKYSTQSLKRGSQWSLLDRSSSAEWNKHWTRQADHHLCCLITAPDFFIYRQDDISRNRLEQSQHEQIPERPAEDSVRTAFTGSPAAVSLWDLFTDDYSHRNQPHSSSCDKIKQTSTFMMDERTSRSAVVGLIFKLLMRRIKKLKLLLKLQNQFLDRFEETGWTAARSWFSVLTRFSSHIIA